MIYMDEDIESSDSDWVEEEDDGEELKNMSLLRVGLLFFYDGESRRGNSNGPSSRRGIKVGGGGCRSGEGGGGEV